ncbi:SPFH domain-containing protein [Lacrimispora sp.]|jgi:membrane protease subunit (stomatin/prohibitin family)|uniref:SPFH domain-containing protein n=1 Tax=Lacrimispora sp. TaxID=2719234 RepID=UPI0028A9E5DC|nr:SPFH domain-containing protein [Lacrimispora sp.]
MGIVKALTTAVGGSLADQWLEVIEAGNMGDQTVFAGGVKIRKGSNTKSTDYTVSDGSVIHVYPNQFMLLVDGGKVIDYTGEPGYFTVKNSSLPSLFNGQFDEALKESFDRIRFGGQTPTAQKVYFINLQEIKGIKFGTPNPINYFDQFYNAELFLRAHGTYSIKVTDPLLFYAEAIPKNTSRVEVDDINAQYLSEFLEALQSSINQMSADGIRISYVASKGRELGQYMADILDDEWKIQRGIEIQSVGIASISYDEESKELIHLRNQGAMLSDPGVREGYVQGAVARGLEAAGSNANGSMAGFMGMGMGMNAGGGFMGAASSTNFQQMQMDRAQQGNPGERTAAGGESKAESPSDSPWTCSCGNVNTGKFCPECGNPKPAETWTCECKTVNNGRFCSECGKPRP